MTATEKTVGLAMSGGGYRASAWGLGSLLALTDCRHEDAPLDDEVVVPRVSMVASVSGGSITNAAFGLGMNLDEASTDDVDQRASEMAPLYVGNQWLSWRRLPPSFLPLLLLAMAAGSGLAAVLLRDTIAHDGARWLVVSAGATVVGVAFGWLCRDLLFGWWLAWLYVGGAVAGICGVVWILFLPWGTSSRLGWAVVAVFGLATFLVSRPYVVERAFEARFKNLGAGPYPNLHQLGLRREPRSPTDYAVVHVICTTDLSGANFTYLGSGFAYNFDFGISDTPSVTVAAAVQASSNLPGAFRGCAGWTETTWISATDETARPAATALPMAGCTRTWAASGSPASTSGSAASPGPRPTRSANGSVDASMRRTSWW